MSDTAKIIAHLESLPDGALMSDACARVVAMQWHGGQSSALYALGSSGAITDDAFGEICAELRPVQEARDLDGQQALGALLTYVAERGERGPVDGWAALWL